MIISQQHARALCGSGVGDRGSGGHSAISRRFWKPPILSKLTVFVRTLAALFSTFHARGHIAPAGAAGPKAEVFHDCVFVKGQGARGHMEEVRDFLHQLLIEIYQYPGLAGESGKVRNQTL